MAVGFEFFYPGLLLLIDVGLLGFFLDEDVLLQVYFLAVAPGHLAIYVIKHLLSMVLSLVVTSVLFLAIRRFFTI